MKIGEKAIADIKFDPHSRDEITKLLRLFPTCWIKSTKSSSNTVMTSPVKKKDENLKGLRVQKQDRVKSARLPREWMMMGVTRDFSIS
jgi:hypothetical protein